MCPPRANGPKTEQAKDAGPKACDGKPRPEDAGMRRFAGSFAQLLTLEQLNVVVGMQLHDGLLPRPAAARRVAAPLRLRLDAHRPHVLHAHAEDLLHGLADLRLVRT